MAVHRGGALPREVGCGILTVSDTRTETDDASGRLIRQLLDEAGYPIVTYKVVADEPVAIRAAVSGAVERTDLRALVVSGGTGITTRDVTPESIASLWSRELPGFGELFRALSYAEIGPAAFLSRATAGVIAGKFVALLPGSTAACRLALERLVVPALGHVTALLDAEP